MQRRPLLVMLVLAASVLGGVRGDPLPIGWSLQSTNGPSPRWGATLTFDSEQDVCLLVGGFDGQSTLGDLWVWDGSAWSLVAATGLGPRQYHAAAYDSVRHVLVVFGGDKAGQLNGETWEWDGVSWSLRSTSGPSPRRSTSMVFDSARGVIVLFGGQVGSGYSGETWEWDGTSWSLRSTTGPSPRTDYGLAYDSVRGVTVLFGGFDGDWQGDTWEWDGTNWTLRATAGPAPRAVAGMTFDRSRASTILFGGDTGNTMNGETWAWDGRVWIQRAVTGPSPRHRHAMAYDAARERVVLFGGWDGAYDGETWEFANPPACDPFDDGVIDPLNWAVGGTLRGVEGQGSGSWNYSHEEISGPDGHLGIRVWGPTSPNTYGAEAWVSSLRNFNDGTDHLINFEWQYIPNATHIDFLAIQVTDGTPPDVAVPSGVYHWFGSCSGSVDGPSWRNVFFRCHASIQRSVWSMRIDSTSATATVYSGPNAQGQIQGLNTLPVNQPWFIRFIHADATSAGFPGGDNQLYLFDFCAGNLPPPQPEILLSTGSEPDAACVETGETVSVGLAVANLADAANGVQVLLSYDPAVMTLDVAASSQAPGWTRIFLMDNAGQVTGAFINNGGAVGPGAGPFPVASLVFHTVAEGSTNVAFRPDQLPFATRLTLAGDAGSVSGEDLLKTDSGAISIDDTTLTAANTGPACAGTDATLLGGPDGMASYSWVGPGGFASTEQNPVVSPAEPGEYCLTATNADGCSLGPVCTTVEVYSCLTVEIRIPGLDDAAVVREVEFQLTTCGEMPETRTVPVAFTPAGGSGVGTVLLENVDPALNWVGVVEGHTLGTLVAVNLAGGSASVAATLRSGDLQSELILQDGLVDVIDFAILASRFGTLVADCSTGNPQDCALGADVTGDAWQNQADFDLMQQYFFATGDPVDGCMAVGGGDGSVRILPRQTIAVAALANLLPLASRADLTGDGQIDAQDIRTFARRHGLALKPKFEAQLRSLERGSSQLETTR